MSLVIVVKIGNVEIKGKVFCAPMAGITNLVYRKIAKEYGASLVYSEMISDKALCFNSENTYKMIEIDENEHPVALQLFGGEKEYLVNATKILNNTKADIIDINMGCPVPKVIKSQAGSFWLKNLNDSYEKIKAIVEVSKKPVTAKIRIGWDEDSINVVETAKMLEKAGVSAIAVHGRTKTQLYSGKARLEYIKLVKENVSIPVIGNGDIKSIDDAIKMFGETKCDAIMIGRGALGNPWLFKQINHYLETGEKLENPTCIEKINLCVKHAEELCKIKEEKTAIKEMRTHACYYVKGMPKSTNLKNEINKIETFEIFKKLMLDYRKELEELECQ